MGKWAALPVAEAPGGARDDRKVLHLKLPQMRRRRKAGRLGDP